MTSSSVYSTSKHGQTETIIQAENPAQATLFTQITRPLESYSNYKTQKFVTDQQVANLNTEFSKYTWKL